jgi:hypothetical protein
MLRVLLSGCFLLAAGTSALAEEVRAASSFEPWIGHIAITVLGCLVAIHLAFEAFARPVQIANAPTFPKYMTSPLQYRLGSWIFVLFACSFFLLLVYEHRQVATAVSLFENDLPQFGKSALKAIQDETPSYLLIIVTMGGLYLYLLTKESQWNVLFMMRDTIHCWISIPGLARDIVERVQSSLRVPEEAVARVVSANGGSVRVPDFGKDRLTLDRQWAETCYMKWWLEPKQDASDDATFFAEPSYGFRNLVREFKLTALAVRACKWVMTRRPLRRKYLP